MKKARHQAGFFFRKTQSGLCHICTEFGFGLDHHLDNNLQFIRIAIRHLAKLGACDL